PWAKGSVPPPMDKCKKNEDETSNFKPSKVQGDQ
ncbi:unnamed protein product, partial [Rotaria magnacalcarata]